MSIVETYKDQFNIYLFDEDTTRTDRISMGLRKQGYAIKSFSSRGLFTETLKTELPHVVILFYQPLSLKFRKLLNLIRENSTEIEVVLLGSKEFWPGIHSLMRSGLVNDFWSWPLAGEEELEWRLSKVIERNIFKFIAEQRSAETQAIVSRLDELADIPPLMNQDIRSVGPNEATLPNSSMKTESRLIEDLVQQLKAQFPDSEFVYFKNYQAKDQLLVTRTSFASENYFRGQSVPFHQETLQVDRAEALNKLRDLIEQTFSCEEFIAQPVELAGEFFGLIMAVNFSESQYLQRTAHYLALSLRNQILETQSSSMAIDDGLEIGLSKSQFPLAVSTEVSRARRLKQPVSVFVTQIEYVGEGSADFDKAFALIKNQLRSYDFISRIGDNQIGVVLPHCRYEDAAIKAETLRRMLVARGLKSQNTPLRLCFGVSEYPSLSQDSDSLIADAKQACSQVLVSGKNKVCLYTKPDNFEPEFSIQP